MCGYCGSSDPAQQPLSEAIVRPLARVEQELLICCCRISMDPLTAGRAKDCIADGVDWEYLLQIASLHCLVPLVYHHLRDFSDLIPLPIFERLRSHYLRNALQFQSLSDELMRLLSHIESQGVQVLPYKGPVLAHLVHGDDMLRWAGDLDLVVHPADAPRAAALLSELGYQTSSGVACEILRGAGQCSFIHRDTQCKVELHWAFVERGHPFVEAVSSIWMRRGAIHFRGREVSALQTEDLLLVLCVHATKHRWNRLSWLCDISELIRVSPDLDWSRLYTEAHRYGCSRYVTIGLTLANDLLGVPLPEFVQRRRVASIRKLGAMIYPILFDISKDPYVCRVWWRVPYECLLRERVADRAGFCVRHIGGRICAKVWNGTGGAVAAMVKQPRKRE